MLQYLPLVLCVFGVSAVPMNIFGNKYPYRLADAESANNLNGESNSDRISYYNEFDPRKNIRHAEPNVYPNASVEAQLPHAESLPASPSLPVEVNPNQLPLAKISEDSVQNQQLQKMVQELYMAQGQVQIEATEIQRAQTIASAAQHNLEESSNNVRVITAALRAAQETVANAALRAQTAQLQLAAHDQLLFTARQKVDALSAQMVALQAEVGISADTRMSIDLPALLNRLKQPLAPQDQPKAINPMANQTSPVDDSHPVIIHSADPNAFAPQQQQQRLPNAAKRSISGGSLHQRHVLEADDVRDMLDWVRRQKSAEIAKVSAGSADAFNAKRSADYSQKFVRDFVSNMQSLNQLGDGGGYNDGRMRDQMQPSFDNGGQQIERDGRLTRRAVRRRRRRSHRA